MACISISDLQPVGLELFDDSESYLTEIGGTELSVHGGLTPSSPFCASLAVTAVAASAGAVVSGVVGYFSRR
jgi:hypothetical protein